MSDEPATQTPGDRLREIADRLERMRQDNEENNDRMNSGRFFRDRLDKGEK